MKGGEPKLTFHSASHFSDGGTFDAMQRSDDLLGPYHS